MSRTPLVFASYRSPITFARINEHHPVPRQCYPEGSWCAAVTDLSRERDVLWAALTATDADTEVQRANGEMSFACAAEGRPYRLRLVTPPASEYRNTRILGDNLVWPIQHHQVAPHAAPELAQLAANAHAHGYRAVNVQMATAVLQEVAEDPAIVMLADNYLLEVPALLRAARPDLLIQYTFHTPWTHPDTWRVLPRGVREELFGSLVACDILGFLTRRWARNFMLCCQELLGLDVDVAAGTVRGRDGRTTRIRTYPLSVSSDTFDELARSANVRRHERALERYRARQVVLLVARPEASKHVDVTLAALDALLTEHPELDDRIMMICHLIDRSDLPMRRYPDHIERLRSIVEDINARHGAVIELRIRHDLEEAVAAYKRYDVLVVGSCIDGMNRVAKEAAAVNERDGVLVLSENAGVIEEFGDAALVFNPYDVDEQAAAIHDALTMASRERAVRALRLRATARTGSPAAWIASQIEDLEAL